MAISQAVETFWKHLEQSGLIPVRQVKALARELAAEGVTSDSTLAKKLVDQGYLTRFQAYRLLEGRARGFFFDNYKLLDLFGVGGMGWIYRAENTLTKEIVALKVLLEQFKNDRGISVRFEQEAEISAYFHHENIVRTLGHGTAGGLPYVVMELVEGPSLLELLRLRERSRLPWEQACDIARQAAMALAEVHRGGYVHRDIKPQNLLVDRTGQVKLLDFGLSMHIDGVEGDEFSMAMIFGHECVGTAAFMAPEQIVDSLKADSRSDIYGLGCTLFALLVGDTPFPFSETKEILKAHQFTIPRNVCDIVNTIPKPVGEIVAKMLAKKPEDRFATADDVVAALTSWATRSPVEFDFSKILSERNKTAREKIVEIQRKSQNSSNATNSTARPTSNSAVSPSSTGPVPIIGVDNRASSASTSAVRRDPFGFDNSPQMILRKTSDPEKREDLTTARAIRSGMVLIPLNGGSAVPLLVERFVIGRAPDCDLQIQDSSVSSHHCELQFDGRHWYLVDLNSRNGVRVNGDPVKKQALRRGDTIVVGGSVRLRFNDLRNHSSVLSGQQLRVIMTVIVTIVVGFMIAGTIFKVWNLSGR